MTDSRNRLINVVLDETSLGRGAPEVEHERKVAIFDLLEDNSFSLVGREDGPYQLYISVDGRKLIFDIRQEDNTPATAIILALGPLLRVIKDYFMICESYYDAIRLASPDKIEAIDMGRRGLHNEGSRTLMERLEGKVEVDMDTARRLFTLVCALQRRI